MATKIQDFEKLGAFYMGREYDVDAGETLDDLVMYDAKDLTTHAVCVGMTGSGKTGLCVGLLEEAAIDGVPSIVIDPKGDMGNLLLNFPRLRPEDFEPWVDPGEASRKGRSVSEHAEAVSELWRGGLKSWGQSGKRVRKLADSAEMAIYTPGSDAGIPLTVLRSFEAPSEEVRADREAFNERVQAATAGLLALVGIDADPIQSREAILIASLLSHAWGEARGLSIADMIRLIQRPPFDTLGVLDLETFYPSKDRAKLALTLNGVLASPQFAPWLEGEPLDIQRLLYTEEGKPRVAVLSIAHLSEAERMFFVTIVLNEIVSWVRSQAGTGSLRAILYMDEIFGYFPPTAEPPSKKPMLTLLKQARAYGLGVVLATQNPVDLDYKGLSNTGTWFIGRLQTERDKLRVLDGLEGAMTGGGKSFDRERVDAILSGLGKRVFLMNNVHEREPVLFSTRWVLSYLRGPLTRSQIKTLMAGRKPKKASAPSVAPAKKNVKAAPAAESRPVVPEGVRERFLALGRDVSEKDRLVYRPALACNVKLHYANARAKVDKWVDVSVVAPMDDDDPVVDWEESEYTEGESSRDERRKPEAGASFGELPAPARNAKKYTAWGRELKRHVYEHRRITMWKSAELKLVSEFDESEADFRVRANQAARERRDAAIEKLRAKYATKIDRLHERVRKATEKVGYEEEQYRQSRRGSWLNIGTTILGGLLGRKTVSYTNARRAGSAVKSMGKASKEKSDVERAERALAVEKEKLAAMEQELKDEVAELRAEAESELELDEIVVAPRKSDIAVSEPTLLWRAWAVDEDGIAEAAYV